MLGQILRCLKSKYLSFIPAQRVFLYVGRDVSPIFGLDGRYRSLRTDHRVKFFFFFFSKFACALLGCHLLMSSRLEWP